MWDLFNLLNFCCRLLLFCFFQREWNHHQLRCCPLWPPQDSLRREASGAKLSQHDRLQSGPRILQWTTCRHWGKFISKHEIHEPVPFLLLMRLGNSPHSNNEVERFKEIKNVKKWSLTMQTPDITDLLTIPAYYRCISFHCDIKKNISGSSEWWWDLWLWSRGYDELPPV